MVRGNGRGQTFNVIRNAIEERYAIMFDGASRHSYHFACQLDACVILSGTPGARIKDAGSGVRRRVRLMALQVWLMILPVAFVPVLLVRLEAQEESAFERELCEIFRADLVRRTVLSDRNLLVEKVAIN